MKTATEIPTSFYIPPCVGFASHRWIFVAGPWRSEIRAGGPRHIEYTRIQVPPDQVPDTTQGFSKKQLKGSFQRLWKLVESREMDWMQEAVEHLRAICEGEA